MKKIMITVIATAVLGIGGGITAVTLNGANNTAVADIEVSNELLKSGTYYLNGDVNAEMWIEVNPDFLTLKGNDIDKSLMEAMIRIHEENDIPATDEQLESELETNKVLYCAEKLYHLGYVGMGEWMPYAIYVDRYNDITDREELEELVNRGAGAAFRFNDKTNTIGLAVGDFTLVE